jgi:site-specific DNA-methyltransferase (adenine-specific)
VKSFLNGRVQVHAGDCLDVMSGLDDNAFDSCVCDPPYHLTSIVKRFGGDTAAAAQFGTDGAFSRASRGFMNKVWDGGDIAFRVETWAKVYRALKPGAYVVAFSSSRTFGRMSVAIEDAGFITHPLVAWIFGTGFPKATRVHAEGWEGWRYGTQALKPAIEPIYVGQKPFEKGLTGTANVLRWGTGAINVDGCRVEAPDADLTAVQRQQTDNNWGGMARSLIGKEIAMYKPGGRWPANLIHDGSEEVITAFPGVYSGPKSRQAFERRSDTGSAARFFYSSKADSDDRLGSKHPTVKPVDLMQYLVRLVTPKGGLVLDPFAGTGTTGEAAFREGCKAVLIEREPEYLADIERRCSLILGGPNERRHATIKAKGKVESAGPLFGGEAA